MKVADVQVFTRVARLASFKAAADQLGVTRSSVSKSIGRLEDSLGVVLITRSPRSCSLTDAGRRFLKHALVVDDALAAAVAAVSGEEQDVVGTLGASIPTSLGAAVTPALVNKFRSLWPRLKLSVQFDEHYADLNGSGLDVAIRIAKRLDDSTLLSRKLGTTPEILVASPGYLARYGTPRHPRELKTHRCLDLGTPLRQKTIWRFRDRNDVLEVPIECSLTTNTSLPLILAACMNDGILLIPQLLVGGELARGRLVEILPEYMDSRQWGIYAVYPNRNPPAKVRAFIDFMRQELPALQTVDRWAPFENRGPKKKKLAIV